MNALFSRVPRTIRALVTRIFSARAAYSLPAVAAAAAVVSTGPHHAAQLVATTQHLMPDSSQTGANDFRVLAQLKAARHADAALPMVTVAAGQSISSIAASRCRAAADWTGIYAASRRAHQTARNANDLTTGQQLTIECDQVPDMANRAPLPPPPPVHVYSLAAHWSHLAHQRHAAEVQAGERSVSDTGYGSPAHAAPVTAAAAGGSAAAASGPVTTTGMSGFESCVISRESGGNAQIWNPSGHWGLFQFDEGTWVSGGGSAASFGHASAAEQEQVFASVYAARGAQPWAPSDGC